MPIQTDFVKQAQAAFARHNKAIATPKNSGPDRETLIARLDGAIADLEQDMGSQIEKFGPLCQD